MEGKRVLVVEDEPDIGQLLIMHLKDRGIDCQHFQDGRQALIELRRSHWDLVILDLRLNGVDGLEICRTLRQEGNALPVLMLTAKSSELDRVLGLEIGADDYVTKPFSVVEVMARVHALLRRVDLDRQKSNGCVALRVGNIWIDEARRRVEVHSKAIELTPKEFDLLLCFVCAPGQVFRRVQLLDQVWGFGYEGYEHTVNSHINRLRTKLAQADDSVEYVITVWGVGYKFNDNLSLEHVA
ncbi:MAG: response regulator transcription factor [Pseudomonadaceae bacterium]|nr:response regulator transcription factor [Pseudomonadaceae bacterium]